MRVHYLQHVPFEGLGWIETWLQQAGATISATRLFEKPSLPSVDDFDLLVVMGGPMSANDEAELPWLVDEKRLIRDAIHAGKAVVGICLGAQLIASSLGAAVYANAQKEIGWFAVSRTPGSEGDGIFEFPSQLRVFHWHGETFDMPAGAVPLAHSPACRNQAFQLGARVIGLQFHLETTPQSARDMVEHCAAGLVEAPYIQNADALLAASDADYAAIHQLMARVLAFVTR